MGIHSGHRQRLKSRFISQGLSGFDDHNILELLLFFSIPRADTNEIAHRLLDRFQTMSAVFDAPYERLLEVKGVSEHTATLIKLIPAMMVAYHEDRNKETVTINSANKAREFFRNRFFGKPNEELQVALLDNKKQLIRVEKLFEGTVNSTPLTAKKIAEAAIKCNAASVIMAHNHPGGVALPSHRDIMATKNVFNALKAIDIELCDHIIVAEGDVSSLADSGGFALFDSKF